MSDEETQKPGYPTDVVTPIVKQLGELFSREEKKEIPAFKGKPFDKPVIYWIKHAERVAQSNGWDAEQKIRFFSDRLGGEAIDLHTTYAIAKGADIRYDVWKTDLISRFQNDSDIQKLREKFKNIKQKPSQSARAFTAKLNDLFDSIYGKEPIAPLQGAEQIAKDLYNDLIKIRTDSKRRILLRGLLPQILHELWHRLATDSSFEELCENVYEAEKIVIIKSLSN